MSSQATRRGFQIAGAVNILGMALFSRALTNEYMAELDPGLFTSAGILLICIWGLAYLALANSYAEAPRVSLVFAIEKAFYALAWARWMLAHAGELPEIFARDWMTGMFFSSYGLVDGAFGLFFAWVWWQHRRPDEA